MSHWCTWSTGENKHRPKPRTANTENVTDCAMLSLCSVSAGRVLGSSVSRTSCQQRGARDTQHCEEMGWRKGDVNRMGERALL